LNPFSVSRIAVNKKRNPADAVRLRKHPAASHIPNHRYISLAYTSLASELTATASTFRPNDVVSACRHQPCHVSATWHQPEREGGTSGYFLLCNAVVRGIAICIQSIGNDRGRIRARR
jgi:hypothetical protein